MGIYVLEPLRLPLEGLDIGLFWSVQDSKFLLQTQRQFPPLFQQPREVFTWFRPIRDDFQVQSIPVPAQPIRVVFRSIWCVFAEF